MMFILLVTSSTTTASAGGGGGCGSGSDTGTVAGSDIHNGVNVKCIIVISGV